MYLPNLAFCITSFDANGNLVYSASSSSISKHKRLEQVNLRKYVIADPICWGANPTIIGDASWSKWDQKYLKDDFGSYILEDYTLTIGMTLDATDVVTVYASTATMAFNLFGSEIA